MLSELTTPAIIVDLDIAERNMQKMADRMRQLGIRLRPHVKTHKSLYFARQQLAAGASGITVAKLSEAVVFADGGIDDIFVAYPIIGEDKLALFERLHMTHHVRTSVDSLAVAQPLAAIGIRTGKPVRVLIEIDGGIHRTGVQPSDLADFAESVRGLGGIEIEGIMAYFAGIYDSPSESDLIQAASNEAKLLTEWAAVLRSRGIEVNEISAGSTPAASCAEHLKGITEVRSGNYLFNDATAVALGFAGESDCALRVLTTVVSTPLPGHVTVDAGSKTLTSDRAHLRDGYGIVVGRPDAKVVALYEEHGLITITGEPLRVGDRIQIIPNHSCVLPNISGVLYGVRGGRLEATIPVEARGCNT